MLAAKRWVIGSVVLLLIGMAWSPVSQSVGLQQSQAGLERALATFAIARGLNAVISMVQGTELAFEPMGIGAVFAIGQVLDPINDLVEQFSSLMLLASVAFGLQILLIKIGAHWLLSVSLTVVAIAYAVMAAWRGGSPGWLVRLFLVLALARFAVPVCALVSEGVYQVFLQQEYVAAWSSLERSKDEIRASERQVSDESVSADVQSEKAQGSLKWIRDGWKPSWPKIPDVKKIAKDIMQAAEKSVQHMIDLMVVFLLQTVVVPLVFLWVIVAAGRSVVSPKGVRHGNGTSPA